MIELLVVIAIMAVLASLVIGLSGVAGRKGKEARIRGELQQWVTAIEDYRTRIGSYPPDNGINRTPGAVKNSVTNQLYYELSGTVLTNNHTLFQTLDGRESITPGTVQEFFRTEGFVNSSTDREQVKNYLPNLKSSQFAELSAALDVEALVVPMEWPRNRSDQPVAGRPGLNPWRYVSTGPTNNPASYDLWAVVVIGGEVRVIGNWKE